MNPTRAFAAGYYPLILTHCKKNMMPGSLWQQSWGQEKPIQFYSDYEVGATYPDRPYWVKVLPGEVVMVVDVEWKETVTEYSDCHEFMEIQLLYGEKVYNKVSYDCVVWVDRFTKVEL